ncbi:hypothetical protein N9Z72_00335 [Akkermansiaceae bacterium]|nr:hypothetical protein [Akkermansiaceae bacterium]
MATWKKVIVSGSSAHLNQVTASGGFSGDGSGLTGISADSLANSLVDGNGIADFTFNGSAGATVALDLNGSTLNLGSSGVKVADAGITATQIATSVAGAGLAGGGGTALSVGVDDSSIEINSDALRVKAAGVTNAMLGGSIANAKLSNSAITIAGASTSLGGSITAAAIGTAIGAFSGSAQVTGITVGQMAANSIDSDQYVDGSIDTAHIAAGQVTNAKLANDGITIAGVDTSLGGSITAATIGTAIGAFSGSAQVTGITVGQMAANSIDSDQYVDGSIDTAHIGANQITNAKMADNAIDTAEIAASAVETAKINNLAVTTAKIANDAVTGDKLADDITIANDLTVAGDLIVSGDTVTVNTANLNVEDQFILINSGSSTATNESGIIFGGSNGAVGAGAALIWNGDYNGNDGRLAVANAVNWNATSATVNYSIAGVFEGSIADAATAQADHTGNIRIESNDIYIYA